MNLDGREIVDGDGRRWRAFAPTWRLWRWAGYLRRRLVVARLPGHFWPFVGWSPGALLPVTIGMPPREILVRVERIEGERFKVARARMLRSVREIMMARRADLFEHSKKKQ